MSSLREFALRAVAFVTRARRRDEDLGDELRFHQSMLEQSLERQGLDPAAAHREARLQLGGPTQIAEAYGDQRTLPWLETVLQDVRYALRTLSRAPGFTLAAMITIALGIGANTAIFTVANTALLRPLPFADPDRLVFFGDTGSDGLPSNIGFQTFADVRDRTRAFQDLAADGRESLPARRANFLCLRHGAGRAAGVVVIGRWKGGNRRHFGLKVLPRQEIVSPAADLRNSCRQRALRISSLHIAVQHNRPYLSRGLGRS